MFFFNVKSSRLTCISYDIVTLIHKLDEVSSTIYHVSSREILKTKTLTYEVNNKNMLKIVKLILYPSLDISYCFKFDRFFSKRKIPIISSYSFNPSDLSLESYKHCSLFRWARLAGGENVYNGTFHILNPKFL